MGMDIGLVRAATWRYCPCYVQAKVLVMSAILKAGISISFWL